MFDLLVYSPPAATALARYPTSTHGDHILSISPMTRRYFHARLDEGATLADLVPAADFLAKASIAHAQDRSACKHLAGDVARSMSLAFGTQDDVAWLFYGRVLKRLLEIMLEEKELIVRNVEVAVATPDNCPAWW